MPAYCTAHKHKRFRYGDLGKRHHLEVDGRPILLKDLQEARREAWTRLIWFRIGTGGMDSIDLVQDRDGRQGID